MINIEETLFPRPMQRMYSKIYSADSTHLISLDDASMILALLSSIYCAFSMEALGRQWMMDPRYAQSFQA